MLRFVSDVTDRLDKFLVSKISEISRSKIQKAIKDSKVLVNGNIVSDSDFQIKPADVIEVEEFPSNELKPSNQEIKIVFENNDVVVIDKPPGLVVHPGAGNTEDTLANILIAKYPTIAEVGDPHRPGIVHRLDEDTSGLILVAKNQDALEYFKQQFKDRKVEKEYLALVSGVPAKMHGIIDAPLEKVPLKQKMKVGSGKEAITEYFLINSDPSGQFSLFRVKLHTGRTHQIRAHLSHIGHPIIGDSVYGKKSDICDRQFLHAYRLKFQLPDGSWMDLESELPEDLQETLNKLELKV